jgi:hypothetical protein
MAGRIRSAPLLIAIIAAVLLYAAGAAALGTPPAADATGTQVVDWFRAHADGVRIYVWVGALGAPFYAFVIACLRRFLPSPHRDMFLIGGITLAATVAVQSWFWAGLALHPSTLEPATARTALDIAVYWGPVLTGATMAMLAPVTALALRGRVGLPRWLGALGAIVFIEQAVETVTVFGSNGFTAPGGPMNTMLGAALFVAWLVAFAVWGALTTPVPSSLGESPARP